MPAEGTLKKLGHGTSLAVQWLRLYVPMQGVAGLIPGRGAKIPHASRPKNQNIKTEATVDRVGSNPG